MTTSHGRPNNKKETKNENIDNNDRDHIDRFHGQSQ
jgi:hypothetical protein